MEKINTPGVHHITLRSSDYQRAKKFYTADLGFEIILEKDNLFIFFAGGTAIAVRGPEEQSPANDQFNPYRVGLDHLALGCTQESDLQQLEKKLNALQVENTGVKTDDTLGKKYIAFKDPDRISWEYYMV